MAELERIAVPGHTGQTAFVFPTMLEAVTALDANWQPGYRSHIEPAPWNKDGWLAAHIDFASGQLLYL